MRAAAWNSIRDGWGALALMASALLVTAGPAAGVVPAPGEWDGATEQAKLDRPYEDRAQATIPFGLISYFARPWRSYMDTWPASQFLGSMGFVMNVKPAYADAVCQVMSQSGIRMVRYELGWGSLDWDDKLSGKKRETVIATLQLFKKHGLRPLILLNAHHGVPCPMRGVSVRVLADAKKGDTILKVQDPKNVRAGYTGFMDKAAYCAGRPLVAAVDADGMCHLSMGLLTDIKAGSTPLLTEMKYQPLQGSQRADGSKVPEAEETVEGWLKYVAEVCAVAKEALGTDGQADAGFDLEVWNELTFGSNFLDINNYYSPKLKYAQGPTYQKTRAVQPGMRPDARTEFKVQGGPMLFGRTVDYIQAHRAEFPGVKLDNGFDNQWPWDSGTDSWDGQSSISRHFYTGGWRDISPSTIKRPEMGTIDALGERDGKRPASPRNPFEIVPGSNFVPTLRLGLPEVHFCAFQTETMTRDLMPDSRLTGMAGHGRYTHNGDMKPVELWQTEFNYSRSGFFKELLSETGAKADDAQVQLLDDHLIGKFLLRSYLFQNHKGLKRLYIFAPGGDDRSLSMFSPRFFTALDKSDGRLTADVRETLPSVYQGLGWISKQMESGEAISAPRPLRVDELVEYKPRLLYAGDGSPAHPHQWNRDWFAFLPYQLSATRFMVPYYVVTTDVTHVWDAAKTPLDPSRYDMPEQDFDVSIGNCLGNNALVSAYDPLTNTATPVQVVQATQTTLIVRLKTVDYPRVLLIEEARPGPQILEPQVVAGRDGRVEVKWRTNFQPDTAKVTYGQDWMNRSDSTMQVTPQGKEYAVQLPAGLKGVIATRITMTANGLTSVWPRWDEDPVGQIVMSGTATATAQPPKNEATAPGDTASSAFSAPAGVKLPMGEVNTPRGYALRLPAGVMLSGPQDDRTGTLGEGPMAVSLRVRYVVGGANSSEGLVPLRAVGDEWQQQAVKLASGLTGTLVDVQLLREAHPDVPELSQRHLLLAFGKSGADLLLVSAAGTPEAMKANAQEVRAIMSSVAGQ